MKIDTKVIIGVISIVALLTGFDWIVFILWIGYGFYKMDEREN